MTLETESVIVDKADLQTYLTRLQELEQAIEDMQTNTSLRQKVEALAKGNVLKASGICKILDWSTRTFYRRVEAGVIPVSVDGTGRYFIDVDEFIKWYNENVKL